MSEIKCIKEHKDLLIESITSSKTKFTLLINEMSTGLSDTVNIFCDRIHSKLKHIEGKYNTQLSVLEHITTENTQQQTKLETITQAFNKTQSDLDNVSNTLHNELNNKKFEEKNYNDVSIIKNLSSQ